MGLISDAANHGGDILGRLRAVEAAIRDMQTARRLESASIGAGGIRIHSGGAITLAGGGNIEVTEGQLVVRAADGALLVRMGPTFNGGGVLQTRHADGSISFTAGQIIQNGLPVGTGFIQEDPDGRNIITVSPATPGGPYLLRIRDGVGEFGNLVFATDPAGLLNRPYIEVPLYVVNGLGTIRWSGNDFQTIWQGRMWITHPALHVHVRAWTADTFTGQVRVMIGGSGDPVQHGPTVNIPNTGGNSAFYDLGTHALDLTANPSYSFRNVMLQARLVGGGDIGAGEHVTVIPYGATKRGLPT